MTGEDVMGKEVKGNKKLNWPKPYFAVVFTAQRSLSGDDIYEITSDRMMDLAQQQPGFLGVESVRGDDGLGITVSYWRDRDAIRAWRENSEHLIAQEMGRQEFYQWYRVRIAEVTDDHAFFADTAI
ncbi:antibiotic biosynthesis monooxygenase family protein [Candidatus Puniceispirillum sp.]|uniref:antibiotic biosynthesis monooxygenase family protein n=1 Tax=Candidatus Puniceispirillum sp. TaxID=2026719 RepID=UPI003F699A7F